MSCSGAFDINEDGQYDTCDSKVCSFDYTYEYASASQCTVTKKSNYLKLEFPSGDSKATFSLGEKGLSEVRLFSPSINKWGGEKADAELILRHMGGGQSVYVCIPIMTALGNQVGNDIEFFSQLSSVFPLSAAPQIVSLGNWSLNKLIPKSPYYWAEKDGLAFDQSCANESSNVLIFPLSGAINIKSSHLNPLKRALSAYDGSPREINSSEDSINQGTDAGKFYYNEKGTKEAGGVGGIDDGLPIGMTCEPVLDAQSGLNVSAEPTAKMSWIQGAMGKMSTDKIKDYVIYALITIGSFLLIFLGYKYCWKGSVEHPDKPGEMTSIMGRWIALKSQGKVDKG